MLKRDNWCPAKQAHITCLYLYNFTISADIYANNIIGQPFGKYQSSNRAGSSP